MSASEGCINPSVVEFPWPWSSAIILLENNPQKHWESFVSPLVITHIYKSSSLQKFTQALFWGEDVAMGVLIIGYGVEMQNYLKWVKYKIFSVEELVKAEASELEHLWWKEYEEETVSQALCLFHLVYYPILEKVKL